MYSMAKRVRSLRIVEAILLVVALSGPWGYEQINVPAEYECQRPFVRLHGDFCGEPVTGLQAVLELGRWGYVWVQHLFIGETGIVDSWSLLLFAAGVGVLLAPLAALVYRATRASSKVWGPHLMLSLLAMAMAGALLIPQGMAPALLWGGWFYVGLLVLVAISEIAVWLARKDGRMAA